MFEPTFVANAKKPWSNTDSSDPPTLFWESRILLFPFLSNHHALCSSPVFHAGPAVNTDLSMWLQIKEQSSPESQLVQMSQFMEKVIFSVVFCSVYCLLGLFPVLCPDTLWLTCMCGNAHTLTHTQPPTVSVLEPISSQQCCSGPQLPGTDPVSRGYARRRNLLMSVTHDHTELVPLSDFPSLFACSLLLI